MLLLSVQVLFLIVSLHRRFTAIWGFVFIKANWEPKSENMKAIASELNVLPESLVFVDDNPAERAIVTGQIPKVNAPEIDTPEHYIRILDHSGFFETTSISEDDRKRNEMYMANRKRTELQESFKDYSEYLKSLEMKAVIAPFEKMYIPTHPFAWTKKGYDNLENYKTLVNEKYVELIDSIDNECKDFGALRDNFEKLPVEL